MDGISAPYGGKQYWTGHNRPVDSVSWYDAMAFCAWLNARIPLPSLPMDPPEGMRYAYRLPLETEWEKAASWEAQAKHAREWAFGDRGTLGHRRCNIDETGFGQTCAVGLFPHAPAPCGAMDMSGNVWEWCLNEYGRAAISIKAAEKTIDSNWPRSVRGGSWHNTDVDARAACRYYGSPDVGNNALAAM